MSPDENLEALHPLLLHHGSQVYVRSDNGHEFATEAIQGWLRRVGIKPIRIYWGSPWENGYVESFNARFRYELLNRELFYSLRDAQIIIEGWRNHYNTKRPNSALGCRPPAQETIIQMDQRPVMH